MGHAVLAMHLDNRCLPFGGAGPPLAHIFHKMMQLLPPAAQAICVKGGFICGAGSDGSVLVWGLHCQTMLKTIKAHDGNIIQMRSNGHHLFTCSTDHTVKYLDLRTWATCTVVVVRKVPQVRLLQSLFELLTLLLHQLQVFFPVSPCRATHSRLVSHSLTVACSLDWQMAVLSSKQWHWLAFDCAWLVTSWKYWSQRMLSVMVICLCLVFFPLAFSTSGHGTTWGHSL